LICIIDGCGHKRRGSSDGSNGYKKGVGKSWYDYGVCPCCALELLYLRTIDGEYQKSRKCIRMLRDEDEKRRMSRRIKITV
jgi:hypothetical protein